MTSRETVEALINKADIIGEIKKISSKVLDGKRISIDEGIILYEKATLSLLGSLANFIREKLHGDKVLVFESG